MKKICFTIFTLAVASISFGQVTFALKAGINRADIYIDAAVEKEAIWGFHAGGMAQTKLSQKFLLQPELVFSKKGFRAPSIMFADGQDIILNYITVPILLGYQLDKRITLLLGPELGLLTSAKSKFSSAEFDETRMYKKFDMGLDFALSIKPVKNIGVDLRYNYGLTRLGSVIVSDRNNNPTFDAKTANRVLQLGLFYQF
jgi:opacity protein-like surface antigen